MKKYFYEIHICVIEADTEKPKSYRRWMNGNKSRSGISYDEWLKYSSFLLMFIPLPAKLLETTGRMEQSLT